MFTDAKVFGSFLEQWIDDFFALDYFRFQWGGGNLALALFGAFDWLFYSWFDWLFI
jgi:hypothetical protein